MLTDTREKEKKDVLKQFLPDPLVNLTQIYLTRVSYDGRSLFGDVAPFKGRVQQQFALPMSCLASTEPNTHKTAWWNNKLYFIGQDPHYHSLTMFELSMETMSCKDLDCFCQGILVNGDTRLDLHYEMVDEDTDFSTCIRATCNRKLKSQNVIQEHGFLVTSFCCTSTELYLCNKLPNILQLLVYNLNTFINVAVFDVVIENSEELIVLELAIDEKENYLYVVTVSDVFSQFQNQLILHRIDLHTKKECIHDRCKMETPKQKFYEVSVSLCLRGHELLMTKGKELYVFNTLGSLKLVTCVSHKEELQSISCHQSGLLCAATQTGFVMFE